MWHSSWLVSVLLFCLHHCHHFYFFMAGILQCVQWCFWQLSKFPYVKVATPGWETLLSETRLCCHRLGIALLLYWLREGLNASHVPDVMFLCFTTEAGVSPCSAWSDEISWRQIMLRRKTAEWWQPGVYSHQNSHTKLWHTHARTLSFTTHKDSQNKSLITWGVSVMSLITDKVWCCRQSRSQILWQYWLQINDKSSIFTDEQ